MNIINIIANNRVDYKEIINSSVREFYYKDTFYCDVLVVVGVRNRMEFVQPVIDSFKKAQHTYKIAIILVEHSPVRKHFPKDVDYVWVRCGEKEQYNRGLAFNVGYFLGVKSKWVLTHDVDCMVQEYFFEKLFRNIEFKNTMAIQPFYNNRVLYCDEGVTNKLLNKQVDINVLNEGSEGIFTVPGKAMGGSLMMTRDLFVKVGGYDPELFTGYAPEDQFMWAKINLFTDIPSCYNPRNEIFHLHHERMNNTNPDLCRMVGIHKHFMSLPAQQKIDIVNYKSEILKSW